MRPSALALATLLVTTFAVAADAPVETTGVHGKVPADVVGRWFAVAQGKMASGALRTIVQAWEIRRGAEHLELTLRRAPFPKPIMDAVQAAGTAKREWQPEDADFRAVAESWNAPPGPDDRVEIASRIVGADAFTPELAKDAVTQGSELAIVVDERFTGSQHVARTTSIYGIRRRSPTELGGTFVGTTVAIVFTAVPITFTGDFVAYRLDGRSWLDRLFAGCRR